MQWPRKFPLKPIRKTKARQFGQNKQKQQCSDQTIKTQAWLKQKQDQKLR